MYGTPLQIRSLGHDVANPLAASPLAISVDNVVIGWRGAPEVFSGFSPDGETWVVVQMSAHRWLCAPASELAVRCLLSGRATALDLITHSSTGMFEDLVLGPDGRFSGSLRLCGDLHAEEQFSLSHLDVHERCA